MSKTVEMKKRSKEKRGVALLIAVLAMLMLTLFAIGFALQTGTDIDVGRAYLEKVKTFYIAQAGFNRARTAISVNETGWSLPPNSPPTTLATESFANGEFVVTASSDATTVSITSTGGIPTALTGRTQRIVQENGISRGGGPPTATASSQQTTFEASKALEQVGTTKYGRGTPWKSQTGTGNVNNTPAPSLVPWIVIDFGTPVSFDYMLFVRDALTSDTILKWTVEVCTPSDADCKTTGTGWASRVTTTMSQFEPLSITGLKDSNIPIYPGLGFQNYWMAVNFLKVGNDNGAVNGGQTTGDCDNNPVTPDGSDHCTGVLPSGAAVVQNTRQVRLTANCVSNCTSTTVAAQVDWIQIKTGGALTRDGATGIFYFTTGTDVQGGSGLAAPKDFTER